LRASERVESAGVLRGPGDAQGVQQLASEVFKAEPQPPAQHASWCARQNASAVRGPAERVCEKWTLTTLPLNSLLAPKNSLLGLQTFPVPLRREFRWESLNSLANCTPKSLQRA